jgi:hypothetical protein
MLQLMKILSGSHLHGTSTPASDIDQKSVAIPDARSILLGKVRFASHEGSTNRSGKRNESHDIDVETLSIKMYLDLLAQGQTNAVEMLFAPDEMHLIAPHPFWRKIQKNSDKLISRRTESFYGYCRTQASKYCARAERIRDVDAAVAFISEMNDEFGAKALLGNACEHIDAFVAKTPGAEIVDITLANGTIVRHLSVCDRRAPFTADIKTALDIYQRQAKIYGQRSRATQDTDLKDYKSLAHAIRIGREAIELYATGRIILPRPDAADLIEIKLGRKSYELILEEIDGLLAALLNAADASTLRNEPDQEFIDDLICEAHLIAIKGATQP